MWYTDYLSLINFKVKNLIVRDFLKNERDVGC